MSEISDIMPAVNVLLAAGQMPSADQVRRMLVVIDKQAAEINRLNKWADGFSDAQLKERRLCEERLREKDSAMGVLFDRLAKAGVDCSDLIS